MLSLGNVIELSQENYKKETSTKGLVVVDFWAPRCGPCRTLSPTLDELAGEMKSVKFAKINVDDNMDISREFGVSAIPTVLIYKDGKVTDRFVGAYPKEQIKKKIEGVEK